MADYARPRGPCARFARQPAKPVSIEWTLRLSVAPPAYAERLCLPSVTIGVAELSFSKRNSYDFNTLTSRLTSILRRLSTLSASPESQRRLYTRRSISRCQAGAYWLIDAIVSYFGSPVMQRAMANDPRICSMQFWRLSVDNQSALLTAEADAGVEPFVTQEIAYTDFPLPEIQVWAGFDGSRGTLYLPSEH